jgi:hypothetical protein
MFTNPHNQNLLNDVMRVLGGETTEKPIKPVPQWITEAAAVTVDAIKETRKTGQVMTLEIQRDILRKHLSEAVEKCNCSVTSEVPMQFEEEVRKGLEEKAPAKLETPASVEAKIKNPASKSMPKNVGLASTGKNPAKIGEQVESDLREFLTQLTTEEITILRNIINETR